MVTEEIADSIENNTMGQSDSDQWIKERSIRITVSQAGNIAKMRKNTKRSKRIELYQKFKVTKQRGMGIGLKGLLRRNIYTTINKMEILT